MEDPGAQDAAPLSGLNHPEGADPLSATLNQTRERLHQQQQDEQMNSQEDTSSSSSEEEEQESQEDAWQPNAKDWKWGGSSSSSSSSENDEDDDDDDGGGGRRSRRKKQRQGERQSSRVASAKAKNAPSPRPPRAATRFTRSALPPAPPPEQKQKDKKQPRRPQRGGKHVRSGSGSEGSEDGMQDEEDESEEDDDDDEPPAPLVREVDPEVGKIHTAEVKAQPELVLCLEFLFQFRDVLRLQCYSSLTLHTLVDALVFSTGGPGSGLLAQLHTELLQGIVSSKNLAEDNWQHYLAQRLALAWSAISSAKHGPPPFEAEKHKEAEVYAAMPATARVHALKALCDLRLERDDVRSAIETAIAEEGGAEGGGKGRGVGKAAATKGAKQLPLPPAPAPARTSRRGAAAAASGAPGAGQKPGGRGGPPPGSGVSLQAMKRQPLGVDGSGFSYWWFDWVEPLKEEGLQFGSVLAREGPLTIPAPSKPKPDSAVASPMAAGKTAGKGVGARTEGGGEQDCHERESKGGPASGKMEGGGGSAGMVEGTENNQKKDQGESPAAEEGEKKGKGIGRGRGGKTIGGKGIKDAAGEEDKQREGKCRGGDRATGKKDDEDAGGAKGRSEKEEESGGKVATPQGKGSKKGQETSSKARKQKPKAMPKYLTYQLPPLPVPGSWEIVACSLEELEVFAAKIGRSLKAQDKDVSSKVNELVTVLKLRIEEAEKAQQAKIRIAKSLGTWGVDSSLSRSARRQQKPVNYRDDVFDKLMKQAIRAGKHRGSDEEPHPRERHGGERRRGAEAGMPPGDDGAPPAGDTKGTAVGKKHKHGNRLSGGHGRGRGSREGSRGAGEGDRGPEDGADAGKGLDSGDATDGANTAKDGNVGDAGTAVGKKHKHDNRVSGGPEDGADAGKVGDATGSCANDAKGGNAVGATEGDGDVKMQETGTTRLEEGSKGASGLENGLHRQQQQQQQEGPQGTQDTTAQGSETREGQACEGMLNKRQRIERGEAEKPDSKQTAGDGHALHSQPH